MKLVKACIAMAAFAALFVVPSVASAIQLTAPTGTPVPTTHPGNTVIATNVAHSGTAKHTLMTLPAVIGGGSITCDVATLTGEVVTNGPNHVQGDITTAQFEGANKSPECTSPLGNVTPTPNHTKNPVHNGSGSLPWCLTAGKEDKLTLRGGKCSEAARPVFFVLDTAFAGECTYQKSVVEGTYTTHPADAVGTINNQEFLKVTGSAFCPGSGKLDMAFTLTLDENGNEGLATYIDP